MKIKAVKRYSGESVKCDSIWEMIDMLKSFIDKYMYKEIKFSELVNRRDKFAFCLLYYYNHYDIIDDTVVRCKKSIMNAKDHYSNGYSFSKYFDNMKIDMDTKRMVKGIIKELDSIDNRK